MRRWSVLALVLALGTVALIGVIAPVALMYHRLHPDRVAIDDDPGRHGLPYEDLSFSSPIDGTTLRGWYLPAARSTGRAVVIVPGIDDNRLVSGIALRLAPALLDAGYDVLTFDLRGEGDSGGSPITLGWRERSDVLGAVAATHAHGEGHVAVLGFSLGGVSAILAAADSPQIEAVIADSAFADLREALAHELGVNDHLPAPVVDYGLWLFREMSGIDPSDVAPVERIGNLAPRRILLIHGDADSTVPLGDSALLLAAAGATAERWVVPGGKHAKSYLADPVGYTTRVLRFLADALQ